MISYQLLEGRTFCVGTLRRGLSCLIALNSSCFWWLWWIEIPFAKTSKEIDKVVVARVREQLWKNLWIDAKSPHYCWPKFKEKLKLKDLRHFIRMWGKQAHMFSCKALYTCIRMFWKRSFFLLFRKNTHHTWRIRIVFARHTKMLKQWRYNSMPYRGWAVWCYDIYDILFDEAKEPTRASKTYENDHL